jgi:hypothetical protein
MISLSISGKMLKMRRERLLEKKTLLTSRLQVQLAPLARPESKRDTT